jgi:PfaB family protein
MRLRSAVDDAPPATLAARCHGDDGPLALALIAANRSELCREIDLALAGLDAAWASGEEWQTPAGSYFTPRPLGRTGKVAFVYPGGINAYLGLGRHLFRLFPEIHDDPAVRSAYSRIGKIDRALYPRSLTPLTLRELEALEQHLNRDLAIMFESGVGIACVVTTLMQRYFRLEPHCHFGYSLGEVSMVCAQGIWSDVGALSARLDRSPLFSHRLSGPKETVRRCWSLADDLPDDSFWGVFIVLAPLSEVLWHLKGEERVFLTHINTPGELVIAGDPQACRRVIAELQCEALRAPFAHVVHCPPVRDEYDALVHLHTGTVDRRPDASFYSAAAYAPLALDSASLARNLTEVLCQPLDFPRLIERVYADGVRIFVELGPGSSCCRWISESLKSREFLAVSLNRRGVHDHLTILRALARLFSHRVDLDLSALYPGATPKEKTMTPAVLTRSNDVPAPSSPSAERDRFLDAQVRALCDNVASANRASLAFLQMRREALQTVGTLIRKQLEAQ